jgi:hypothetical protein
MEVSYIELPIKIAQLVNALANLKVITLMAINGTEELLMKLETIIYSQLKKKCHSKEYMDLNYDFLVYKLEIIKLI